MKSEYKSVRSCSSKKENVEQFNLRKGLIQFIDRIRREENIVLKSPNATGVEHVVSLYR